MTPFSEQRLLALADVIKRTGISARSWRRIIRARKIGVLRIEGSVRIPEVELERFLAERFTPARELRREKDPQEIEAILDRVVPHRGRPRLSGLLPTSAASTSSCSSTRGKVPTIGAADGAGRHGR